ncbi:Tyrosine--tRNA ligase [Scenedesmus sp. PABB004]|nr:Tyrosine--tRNA ligase [Scenedesmus sp. PABB004]
MLVRTLMSSGAVGRAGRASALCGMRCLQSAARSVRPVSRPPQQGACGAAVGAREQQQRRLATSPAAAAAEVEAPACAAAAAGGAQQQPVANLVTVLRSRGLLQDVTSEELEKAAASSCLPIYCGFDPTADSLHLGNLLGIIVLAWAGACGHTPIALLGGATGRVGDPSGRSTERPVMSEDEIQGNVEAIGATLRTILGRAASQLSVGPDGRVAYGAAAGAASGSGSVTVLNNLDWFGPMSFLGFLRDVGKYARVGQMLAKDSVRSRMESESGISFTEFTYQLLQGYDFAHLAREHGVRVQVGGSDQWGNITAGTDLIRKLLGGEGEEPPQCFGLTFPLLVRRAAPRRVHARALARRSGPGAPARAPAPAPRRRQVDSEGRKFGKSTGGAVWLSAERLSPYKFYQYLFQVTDADVIKFLRMLTFLPLHEIDALEAAMAGPGYAPNTAQRLLAEAVTRFVHGEEGLAQAVKATEALRPGAATALDAATLEAIAGDAPSCALPSSALVGAPLTEVMVASGMLKSKGEVRRLIRGGGVYLNNAKVSDELASVGPADLIDGRLLLLAAGKKNKMLVRVPGQGAARCPTDRKAMASWALVAVLLASALGGAAAGLAAPDACSGVVPGLCERVIAVPTGYSLTLCGNNKTCGMVITSTPQPACSLAPAGVSAAALERAAGVCNASDALAVLVARAPALMQAGTPAAAVPFRRATVDLLSAVAAQEAALTAAAGAAGVGVNDVPLQDQLEEQLALRTLAGTRGLQYVYAPPLTPAGLRDAASRLEPCVAAAPDDADSCAPFVDWFAAYAETAFQSASGDLGSVLALVVTVLDDLAAAAEEVRRRVADMLSVASYAGFLDGAGGAAESQGCLDPHECFDGLLNATWMQLQHEVPATLNAAHPVLDAAEALVAAINASRADAAAAAAASASARDDPAARRAALERALLALMRGDAGAGSARAALEAGPALLARLLAGYAGLPLLAGWEAPAAALAGLADALGGAFGEASAQYAARLQLALKTIAESQHEIMELLPGVTTHMSTCPDGSLHARCDGVDACALAAPDANGTAVAAPTGCGEGLRCVTDACRGCAASCVRSTTTASALATLAVLKDWLGRLRTDTTLTSASSSVKAQLPRLRDALAYLKSAASAPSAGGSRAAPHAWPRGPPSAVADPAAAACRRTRARAAVGDRGLLWRAGVLAFNRQLAIAQLPAFPCPAGSTKRCFTAGKWKRCATVAKVGSCSLGTEPVALPNGHIPWVATHLGLQDALWRSLDLLAGPARAAARGSG